MDYLNKFKKINISVLIAHSLRLILIITVIAALGLFGIYPANAASLSAKLAGRILLQVEQNGEAWYIEPESHSRYFLGRPDDAFDIMRSKGLGILDEHIEQIPIGLEELSGTDTDQDGLSDIFEDAIGTNTESVDSDGDGVEDLEEVLNNDNPLGTSSLSFNSNLSSQLSGRILIQVERHGEAWYVSPVNHKRYFLGRPADAFQVMRSLGLGITDNDLKTIAVAEDSKPTNAVEDHSTTAYTDPEGKFSFNYPIYFGEPSTGVWQYDYTDEVGDSAQAIRFSEFSSHEISEGKLNALRGEVVVTKGRVWVSDGLGGYHNHLTIELDDPTAPIQSGVLAHAAELTADNFCEELSKEIHLNTETINYTSLPAEDQEALIQFDQFRNEDLLVVSCKQQGNTVTFHKVATYVQGVAYNRQHIYGAIRFLNSGPYSSVQLIRVELETPSNKLIDEMREVVDSFEIQ